MQSVGRSNKIDEAMTIPTVEQLDQLSREDLLSLVKDLILIVNQQQMRIAELEAEIAKLRQPPTTSSNSSQPPSRDQKANKPKKKHRKKHGSPMGHPKHSRPLVDNPDQVVVASVVECEHCHASLKGIEPDEIVKRQITEIPPAKPVVIETQQYKTTCPHCQQINYGALPKGLEPERYLGPNLEATVIYYKQPQHLSYERIVETMRDLHGVTLSEGVVAAILKRGGKLAQPVAEQIKQQVITSKVVKSDETSARVNGRNWWQWVFISEAGVYHVIVPTRGATEINVVMGSLCVEIRVCDCFSSQLKAPAKVFQLCLAHQLRDLQRVIDAAPRERWARQMQKLFCDAIHLRNRFIEGEMTVDGFSRRVTEIENDLDRLLERSLTNEGSCKLQVRYSTHRDKLLTFLHYPEVPPTNNESERALRPSVVHRKVTNGFRSEWGAKAYAAIQTVLATAKLKGEDVFQALVKLMGTPVLPFLECSGP
jgi:transposase